MIELSQNQLAETQKLIEQEFKKLYETTQNLGKQNQVLNTRLQNLLQTDFQNGFSNKEHQQQAWSNLVCKLRKRVHFSLIHVF